MPSQQRDEEQAEQSEHMLREKELLQEIDQSSKIPSQGNLTAIFLFIMRQVQGLSDLY